MNTNSLLLRLKCLIVLICLAVLDIGPIPITALGGIVIILFRPRWLKQLVGQLYE